MMLSHSNSFFTPLMKYLFGGLLFLLATASFAQEDDYQVGLNPNLIWQNQGAFYDYSDPGGLNIRVSVWGYVKYPGRYPGCSGSSKTLL